MGTVREVRMPLAWVEGLPQVSLNEVVVFENNVRGLVKALSRQAVEVLLLSGDPAQVGQQVVATGEELSVRVGAHLAGTTITALGETAVGPALVGGESRPVIDVRPRPIQERRRITAPLVTGVSVVDLMLPIGRGQRQLIIGDTKTGKGSFAQTALQAQAELGTMVVYAAIGKRWGDVKSLQEFITTSVAYKNVIVVASFAHDPASLIWLTPYTAMTVAEWWVEQGRETLIIFDDLSTQAQIHREISLMGRRFPGRESYPGDTFYMQARLLERAGNFAGKDGQDVPLSCLPIGETIEGALTSHIISNLISITDGHMLFDASLYNEGQNPPVAIGLSVTRVGRQTQLPVAKKLTRELSAALSKYAKAKELSHFGAELSEETKAALEFGERVAAFFSQPTGAAGLRIPFSVQLTAAAMLWLGWLAEVKPQDVAAARGELLARYEEDGEVQEALNALLACRDLDELKARLEPQKDFLRRLCRLPVTASPVTISS